MTDKELIRRRFASSLKDYDRLAVVQQQICAELAAMVDGSGALTAGASPSFLRAMEIGAGTGFLTRLLAPLAEHWTLNDLTEASGRWITPFVAGRGHDLLWGDAETVPFPEGLSLIASASTVQWFDDLPAFLDKCAGATAPGGILALSSFGPENFSEIKALTGQGLDYHTAEEIDAMVRAAGFRVRECRAYTRSLHFADGTEVLHHIRATGVNSLSRTPWTRRRLAEFSQRYAELFPSPDGGVALTYHPILLTAIRS